MQDGPWPQLPSGYQLIGAYGMLLAVPAEWNPVVLRGSGGGALRSWRAADPAPRGVIALADLRSTQVEVRWRTFRSSARVVTEVERMARKLSRSGLQVQRHTRAIFIRDASDPSGSKALQVLIPDDARLYEMHLPGQPRAAHTSIIDWFLDANNAAARQLRQGHLWTFYGCWGWAPVTSRVQHLLLHPGRVEITLGYRGGEIALGANGLADRLLADKTLLEWAKSVRREGRSAGQWQVEGETVSYAGTEMRKFCKRVHHTLEFRLDAAENRIVWRHQKKWGGGADESVALPGIPSLP